MNNNCNSELVDTHVMEGDVVSAKQPWDNIKVRVITRAFYEDAYLDFFIKYYAALGFDTITILKADADKFNYTLPDLHEFIDKQPNIEIIPVMNEGNQILQTHYGYYADKSYDWILNIDADEFLIIDPELYPSGIKEFIYKIGQRIATTKNIPNADAIQQIKFRWMCVNKFNNKTYSTLTNDSIVNKKVIPENSDIESINSVSFAGYFLTNKLEFYRYIKSMCNTKWANNTGKINAHFFFPIPHTNGRNYNLLDGYFKGVNNSDPRYYPNNGTMLMDGYILHLNTRSLANSVTKCLVTQLRDNKKIKDPVAFQNLINEYSASTQTESSIEEIKTKFTDLLNSKGYFPNKIRQFNAKMGKLIKPDKWQRPLKNMLTEFTDVKTKQRLCNLIKYTPVCNQELEWQILHDLCLANNLNPTNMRAIIDLF